MNILLWWQLKRNGMPDSQFRDLNAVAHQLKPLDVHLSREAKDAIAEQIGFKPVHVKTRRRMEMAGAFTILLFLTVAAQFANPGSPLYALKRGTQNVRAIVQPSYKQELEQEREQEREENRTEERANDDRQRGDDDSRGSNGDSDSDSSDGSDSNSRDESGDDDSSSGNHRRGDDSRKSDDSSGSDNDSGSSNSGSNSGENDIDDD